MPTDPKNPPDAPNNVAAEKLYDNSPTMVPPEAEPKIRAPLPPRPGSFYSSSLYDSALKQRGDDLFTQAGIDESEQRRIAGSFETIGKDTGLPDGALALVADGHVSNLLAAARVSTDPDADDLALAQEIEANNQQNREWFVAQFGRSDAEQMLDRTRRFVRKYPALAKMLQTRGLGSKPAIVQAIAHHVFSTGWR